MAKLIIVESPGKIKTIASFLPKDYVVMASIGHIRLLDKTGKYNLGINIEGNFEPTYINDPEKKDVIKKLKAAAKAADAVYLASDDDLEGESISWHLSEILGVPPKKLFRITFNEITKKAVEEALKNPRQIDDKKVSAQEARRLIDRIAGFRMSGVTISKLKAKSAGRVQSAALKILVDRELEIKAFIPEEYFEIFLPFAKNKKDYKAKYKGTDKKKMVSIPTQAIVDGIVKDCKTGNYTVGNISSKERMMKARPPYTTSTFQQEISAKLNYGSKKAMMIAQSLYEGVNVNGTHQGLITYMRTDSTRLSDEFVAEAKALIEKNYGKNYYSGKINDSKKSGQENVQNAHEGIRPSHLELTPDKVQQFLSNEQFKVYTLIYNRAIAALMVDAKIKDTEVMIHNGTHRFGITGHEVVFDGYMKIYNEFKEDSDEEGEGILPAFTVGEKIADKPLIVEKKQTTPPGRYTEASLVKKMEELGIGRPSTYASIMETLKNREYVELSNKSIVPTDKGISVSKMLSEYFSMIVNTTYTAQLEQQLDDIAEGKADKLIQIKTFYTAFDPLVKKAQKELVREKPTMTDKKCPKCGAPLVIRKGKFGEFLACSKYPKCKYTEKIVPQGAASTDPNAQGAAPAVAPQPVVDTGIICKVCGKGHLVERTAKTGKSAGSKFYACNAFPKCKTTYSQEQFTLEFGKKAEFSDMSTDSDE
jgi:DNA topoisomerase I